MDKLFKFPVKLPWNRKPAQDIEEALSHVPASLTRLPFLKNQSFFYREEDLVALEQLLITEGRPTSRVVLQGPDGIGKSELVVTFCYQHAADFARIDWFQASAASAYRDGTTIYEVPPVEDGESAIEPQKRLIVLEDVNDPDVLRAWVKKLPKVRLLITSTCTDWPGDLKVKTHTLERFHRSESIQLLRQTASRLEKASDTELDRLAACLCDLPLAVTLVGRFLANRPRLSVNETLTQIIDASAKLPEPVALWARESTMACADGVAALFWLLQQELSGRTGHFSQHLLLYASFCAPGRPIPTRLLRTATGMSPDDFAPVLRRLAELGLLTETIHGQMIHPLLAEFTRLSEAKDQRCLEALITAAAEMGVAANQTEEPQDDADLWVHLHYIASHADLCKFEHASSLWNNLGYHWWKAGELRTAKTCLQRGLKIDEEILGEDNPEIATSANNLGRVLFDLHDLQGAKECFNRAMMIDEKAYSGLYPGVAQDAENLGRVQFELEEYPAALSTFQKALYIYENAYGYGPKHIAVSHVASSIGQVFKEMDRLGEARQAYEKALMVDEWVYGPVNIKIAENLYALGRLQRDMGDFQAALVTFERLLNIQEMTYGEEHELLAPTLNSLGLTLQDNGILTRARDCFERAMAIDEAIYGLDHVNIARDANNLGSVMRDLGNLAEARKYFERALKINVLIYGKDHPHIATNTNNLARVLYSLGELEEARHGFERVLLIDEKTYGTRSLEVATDLNNLGIIANDLRLFTEARPLFERALGIFADKLPAEHSKILKARKYLERAKRKISTGSLTDKIE